MMEHLQMGMPVGILKAKLTMNTVIKPAVKGAIINSRGNNLAEALTHLETGFSANPIMMAETLSETVSKLTTNRKNVFFRNLKNTQANEKYTNVLQNIQQQINGVKGIGRRSVDSSLEKLLDMANENGVSLNQIV